MTKIYVVMCYDYSNTGCGGAFLDADVAAAVARAHDGTVEEYDSDMELTPEEARFHRPGVRQWTVRMGDDGQGAQVNEEWEKVDNEAWRASERLRTFITNVVAPDEAAAIKVANERRTRWLALGGYRMPGGSQKTAYGWIDWEAGMLV